VFRLGAIANLLSIPVTTGFLAGIAGLIVVSQAPALLGLTAPSGSVADKMVGLSHEITGANPLCVAIGFSVLACMLLSERINPRIPGALIGLGAATLLVGMLGLEAHGVSALGAVAGVAPRLALPLGSFAELIQLAPLAVIVALVVMVQSAATTRSFPSNPNQAPDVNHDFLGVGAANILSGLLGVFPVNASPPRTAVVAETGGVSQLSALLCALLVGLLASVGAGLLTHVPYAALAGVLLFVAQRIFRLSVMADVLRHSFAEFGLILVTALAILFLPIQEGVAIGIILSLLHGIWTTSRAQTIELKRIPGSSIWWPQGFESPGETLPRVRVVALQAPLSFLNAYDFQNSIQVLLLAAADTRLLVIESNAIVEIDYTGAKILSDVIKRLRAQGVDVAFARLESVRAQYSFEQLGLLALVGPDHVFRSVEEAVRAFAI
jgi:MFS superfamily sulfate permease-like transporter